MFRVPPELVRGVLVARRNSVNPLGVYEVAPGQLAEFTVDHNTEETWVLSVSEPDAPAGYGPSHSVLVAPGYDKPWAVYGYGERVAELQSLGESASLRAAVELAIIKLIEDWET